MAPLSILVSLFAAVALAKRTAPKHVQLHSQAVANGPGLVPDLVHSFSAAHPATMVVASVQAGITPHLHPRKRGRHLQSNRSPSMSMEDGRRHLLNLPSDWKAAGENGSAPLAYGRNDYEIPMQLLREDLLEAMDASRTTNALRMDDVSAWVSATSNPDWKDEKKQTADEMIPNMSKALDALKADIAHILRFENDPLRLAPTDWDMYTDDFETDFTNIANPTALRVLGAVAPALAPTIKGLNLNKQALQELRVLCAKFVNKDVVMQTTGIGANPLTREQVITSHWKTELRMKPLKVPLLLQRFVGADWTPESIVTIDAVSRFQFNDEGKIYRHSVDRFGFLLDKKRVNSTQTDLLLRSTDLFQDFSRDPWLYAWFLVHGDPLSFFDF